MKKILWFSRSGDLTSFSRITDSMMPFISKQYDVTLLSNNANTNCTKNVILGSPTQEIAFSKFNELVRKYDSSVTVAEIGLRYSLIQMTELIYDGDYEFVVICNGIYEVDWLVETILEQKKTVLCNKVGKNTKLVVYTPIDYVPSLQVIKHVIFADLLITMTPMMVDYIMLGINGRNGGGVGSGTGVGDGIVRGHGKIVDVGHGSDISTSNGESKERLVERINDLRGVIWNGDRIANSDIIVLNANNCKNSKRKRLDITINAFVELLKIYSAPDSHPLTPMGLAALLDKTSVKGGVTKGVPKLWLHTDLVELRKEYKKELARVPAANLILSNNNVSDDQLNMIYRISNINLQTSTGEGWSLTNMESAMLGSLQIVPDFLVTKYHFKNNRGLLIPVKVVKTVNEKNATVLIGEVSVQDTVDKLKTGIDMVIDGSALPIINNAIEYAKQYTWSNMSERFVDHLERL